MADKALYAVVTAFKSGDRQQARHLIHPLLKQPTSDRWYMAALLSKSPQQARSCLQRALALDPDHDKARERLQQLDLLEADFSPDPAISEADLPPLAALVADDVVLPTEKPFNPHKASVQLADVLQKGGAPPARRQRSIWFYIGVGSALLMSLSATYFVLMVLGSGIPGRIRGIVTGVHPVFVQDATLVYATPVAVVDGTPYYSQPLSEYGDAGATPISAIHGTPVYARPDAVVVVTPSKTRALRLQEPLSDILEPGFAHEYTFEAVRGEELAVGVQFFSFTAQRVGRNVAILSPNDTSAGQACMRDRILQGDNGVAFTCQIHMSGVWKLRLFGREGESSGAYVVALDSFS